MDLVKAFDKVARVLLFKKLYEIGVRGKMLRVIQDMYSKNIANVLVDSCLTNDFGYNLVLFEKVNLDLYYFLFLLMTY